MNSITSIGMSNNYLNSTRINKRNKMSETPVQSEFGQESLSFKGINANLVKETPKNPKRAVAGVVALGSAAALAVKYLLQGVVTPDSKKFNENCKRVYPWYTFSKSNFFDYVVVKKDTKYKGVKNIEKANAGDVLIRDNKGNLSHVTYKDLLSEYNINKDDFDRVLDKAIDKSAQENIYYSKEELQAKAKNKIFAGFLRDKLSGNGKISESDSDDFKSRMLRGIIAEDLDYFYEWNYSGHSYLKGVKVDGKWYAATNSGDCARIFDNILAGRETSGGISQENYEKIVAERDEKTGRP